MEVLFNELSLDEQFKDLDEFKKYLKDDFSKLIKIFLNLNNFEISKKYDLYNLKITKNATFRDIFQIKGNDELSGFRNFLLKLSRTSPFWEDNKRHNCDNNYLFNFKDMCDKSLAESCEREKIVLSFRHNNFLNQNLQIQKNKQNIDVYNIFDKNKFLDFLVFNSKIDLINYFNLRFENLKLIQNLNCYPLIEFIESQKIELQKKIIARILEFFYLKDNNLKIKENLSKDLGDGLLELRGDFENGIFRVFYFYKNNDIVFINGFIKKSQQTPKNEIENAKKIKKDYIKNNMRE